MTYEAWRISYQSSEQAARAAYAECARLQAKIEAMEQQVPVAWARKLGLDVPSFGCVTDLKYRPSNIPESAYIPLYTLPGAQPAPFDDSATIAGLESAVTHLSVLLGSFRALLVDTAGAGHAAPCTRSRPEPKS